MSRFFQVAPIALAVVLSWSTNAMAEEPLTAADLHKLLPGTYHFSVADSVKLVATLGGNGRISATTDKGDHDTGRWRIKGDKICVVFKRWLDRQTHCEGLRNDNGLLRGNGFTIRR